MGESVVHAPVVEHAGSALEVRLADVVARAIAAAIDDAVPQPTSSLAATPGEGLGSVVEPSNGPPAPESPDA